MNYYDELKKRRDDAEALVLAAQKESVHLEESGVSSEVFEEAYNNAAELLYTLYTPANDEFKRVMKRSKEMGVA